MKDTIQIFGIIISTFGVAFLLSAFLDIDWVARSIPRKVLVNMMITGVLFLGGALVLVKIKSLKK